MDFLLKLEHYVLQYRNSSEKDMDSTQGSGTLKLQWGLK